MGAGDMAAYARWLRRLCLIQVVAVVCHAVDEHGTSGGEVVSLDKAEMASLRNPEGASASSVHHTSQRAGSLGSSQNSKAPAAKKTRARMGRSKSKSAGAAAHSSKTLFIHDKRGRRKYNYAHVYDYAMKRRRILAERARKKERHTKEHAKKQQEKDGKTERRLKESESKQ